MRRKKQQSAPAEDFVALRLQWIDRLTRAIDAQPGAPLPLGREISELRRRLELFRDSFVHGVNVTKAQRGLK